jgi:RsiW-degrading membrane proteinase PrsW (M82 family)
LRLQVRRTLLIAFLVAFMALCGFLLLAAVSGDTGVRGFLVGIALAVLPLPVVLAAFSWLDRYEPEPRGLLAFAFFWGATVAALAAAVLNTASTIAVARTVGPGQNVAVTAVFVAPWVEEAAKGAAILAVLLFRRREFDGVVDGIVLAGLTGVGFAFTENVLYFGRAFLQGSHDLGLSGGFFAVGATFLLRGVLAPFAHPLFTAMTGIGLGIAARARPGPTRWLPPIGGYLVAVGLHAIWNLASLSGLRGFVTGYVVVMIPALASAVAVATWSRRREGDTVAARLPAYVDAGWLAQGDVDMLASMPLRKQAVHWAESTHGVGAARRMRDFQHAATELAFLRDRAERLGPAADFAARERSLLAEVAEHRAALADAGG